MSIKDTWQAEDLTSEVFIKVYKHREKINDIEKSGKWLISIARNTLIDYFRKGKHEEPCEGIEYEAEWDHGYEDVIVKDEFERLKDVFSILNRAEKELINLRYHYGMKYKDIGLSMNITENAAKAKLARTINKLRKLSSSRYAS
jgi:RNA polymerase sigma-70 factor (ECF subfamily)